MGARGFSALERVKVFGQEMDVGHMVSCMPTVKDNGKVRHKPLGVILVKGPKLM
jgi:hypothetical protein